MGLGDVVDKLHDKHSLANTGATEEPDLATLGVRRKQVDDFDSRRKHFGFGRLQQTKPAKQM